MKYLISALILLGLLSSAEARQKPSGLHPMCNITMPCVAPMSASDVAETQREQLADMRQSLPGQPVAKHDLAQIITAIYRQPALAGEPMDVLVNGYLIAQGEVVVVNDKFGIRLTDVVTPSERLKRVSRGG